MSKVILVIDDPTCCLMCSCSSVIYQNMKCLALGENLTESEVYDEKPEWCPLKPIPEKSDIHKANTETVLNWIEGWNACIDAILKEDEV